MFNKDFPSLYYWTYDIPNFKELKEYVKSKENSDTKYDQPWKKNCLVDTTCIDETDFVDIIKPSLELFTNNEFKDVVNINFGYPWINHYKRGYYQEVHDHRKADISSVFFLNDGEGFSKFYFTNRYSITASNRLLSIFHQDLDSDMHFPNIREGQVIFFPSTMLHGVSPHQSDEIRQTMSCNFYIV